MARDLELDRETAPRSTDEPQPQQAPEPDAATLSQVGPIPPVAAEAAATATASEQAYDLAADRGVQDWETYKASHPNKWEDKYRWGHSAAAQFIQPHERKAEYVWELKQGKSASQAVKDWLAGPTIADYRARGAAIEIDEVRDEMGDPKFDKLFGSANTNEDANVAPAHRLVISAAEYGIPIGDQMKKVAADAEEQARQAAEPQPIAATPEARVEEKPKSPVAEATPIVVDELAHHEEQHQREA